MIVGSALIGDRAGFGSGIGRLGAGSGSIGAAGTAVKVMKADPPAACTVEGSETQVGGDTEGAKVELRNEAGEKGANYVRIDSVEHDGKAYVGTALQVPLAVTWLDASTSSLAAEVPRFARILLVEDWHSSPSWHTSAGSTAATPAPA